ncbi:MAG: hypothetical protein ACRC7O_08610, partial [Fimbriiglobus sp.]
MGTCRRIGRYEVWKSPPSPVVTMGGEYSRGGQDRYGNPITIPAGYQNSDRTAWPARTFRYVYDRDQIAGYYHDGGLWTRQVWGPGTDNVLARQTSGGSAANAGTKWYLTDRQNSVLGSVLPWAIHDSAGHHVPAGSWASVFTYLGSGADRSWGRDLNASSITSAVDAVRDIFEYTVRPFDHTTGQQNSRH